MTQVDLFTHLQALGDPSSDISQLVEAADAILSTLKSSAWKQVSHTQGMTVHKATHHSTGPAWYARTSTHEKLSFQQMVNSLKTEFTAPTSVRGMKLEKRIDEKVVHLTADFQRRGFGHRDFVQEYIQAEKEGKFYIFSRPNEHEAKHGFVRAWFESVEVVQDRAEGVEWIMITRSDPGGSIPKWLVERGTPTTIAKQGEAFIRWCKDGSITSS